MDLAFNFSPPSLFQKALKRDFYEHSRHTSLRDISPSNPDSKALKHFFFATAFFYKSTGAGVNTISHPLTVIWGQNGYYCSVLFRGSMLMHITFRDEKLNVSQYCLAKNTLIWISIHLNVCHLIYYSLISLFNKTTILSTLDVC